MHRGIPEQGSGQENEADDRPEDVVEYAAEPVSEKPEDRDNEAWCGESQQCHDTWHRSGSSRTRRSEVEVSMIPMRGSVAGSSLCLIRLSRRSHPHCSCEMI